MPPPLAKVSDAAGLKNSSRRSAELALSILPIYVRIPLAQDFKHPPTMPEDEGRGCFRTEEEEDSLLSNSKLVVGAVSSILWESDLKRANSMSIEDVLALSLQGVTTVCPNTFFCLSYL